MKTRTRTSSRFIGLDGQDLNEKRRLVKDAGLMTVPDGFNPATFYASFLERNRPLFDHDGCLKYFDVPLYPQDCLRPGVRLRVRTFANCGALPEALGFLGQMQAICSPLALLLALDLKYDALPKDTWITLPEARNRLPRSMHRPDQPLFPTFRIDGECGKTLFRHGFYDTSWDGSSVLAVTRLRSS